MSAGKETAPSGEAKELSHTCRRRKDMGRNRWKTSCRELRSSDSLNLVLTPVCSHFFTAAGEACRKQTHRVQGQEHKGRLWQ